LLTTGHPPFLSPVVVVGGRVVVCGATTAGRAAAAGGPGRGPPPAVWRGVAVLRRRWPPSPCRGADHCGLYLVAGGGAGAGAGLLIMPRCLCRPAIGGRPHRRPPRRRASPAPFFLADCGWLSVGWVSCSDMICEVEIAMWEGCYPALTLAPTCEANRAS
jgi:hypothetical protein